MPLSGGPTIWGLREAKGRTTRLPEANRPIDLWASHVWSIFRGPKRRTFDFWVIRATETILGIPCFETHPCPRKAKGMLFNAREFHPLDSGRFDS